LAIPTGKKMFGVLQRKVMCQSVRVLPFLCQNTVKCDSSKAKSIGSGSLLVMEMSFKQGQTCHERERSEIAKERYLASGQIWVDAE
jgi:hypothetical protein